MRFYPDNTRRITKRFSPGGELGSDGSSRLSRIVARVLALSEAEVIKQLELTLRRFSHRHRKFGTTLEANFVAVAHCIEHPEDLSDERRQLIGAYFTHEYSVEAAALSNPSIILAPDQSGLEDGDVRIVLSLRSIGEGHLSSIQFRSGRLHRDGRFTMDEPGPYLVTARHRPPRYVKKIFREKLIELRLHGGIAVLVLDALDDQFTMEELNTQIAKIDAESDRSEEASRATRALHWLAASNYESSFDAATDVSERILFPAGPTESSGMEDARFVRFVEDDGSATYFATYTAYNGYQILPQLIETKDLLNFRIATLNGACAKNKGIALFPRKLKGRYAALSRLDNENNYFMTSDDVRFWHQAQLLEKPTHPWGLTQIGNCGSPLETEAGWLVITHEVGPMRQYVLGATLLDLEDPTRVIASLSEPLLEPDEHEREGYVPNVLYSCGSMISGGQLVVPYGFSDSGTGIASFELSELLGELTSGAGAPN